MKRLRIPILIGLLTLCALSRSGYLVSLLIVIGLQAMPAIGLALIAGYTGQISLGHAAFYGLGAYGAALIGKWLGVPAWLDVLLATAIVAALAWAIGWLVFRLKGHYLAMATLAFGIIVQVGLVELHDVTGGPNGLTGIAPLSIFGLALDGDFVFLPVVWIVTIVGIVCAENLIASPTGLAMRAISESENVARSVGNDVQSVKRMVMMVSGLFCALGGSSLCPLCRLSQSWTVRRRLLGQAAPDGRNRRIRRCLGCSVRSHLHHFDRRALEAARCLRCRGLRPAAGGVRDLLPERPACAESLRSQTEGLRMMGAGRPA